MKTVLREQQASYRTIDQNPRPALEERPSYELGQFDIVNDNYAYDEVQAALTNYTNSVSSYVTRLPGSTALVRRGDMEFDGNDRVKATYYKMMKESQTQAR
jgi:hypothetical protein